MLLGKKFSMPKISLIVPVYNAEQYLSRCIDSILAQEFTDFELILVNDGSTDDSLTICRKYEDKDSRVIVLDKPNGGASSARNRGLEVAKGDYICFVDADDYVSQNYLGDLYQDMCRENGIVLVMHGMIQVKGDHQAVISLSKSKTYKLDDGTFFNDINLFKFCGPCCKLFSREIIVDKRIRFSEDIICAEDFDFMAKYMTLCKKVRIADVNNYYYVAHADSVSTRIYSFKQEYSGLKSLTKSLSALSRKFQNPALDKQVNDFIAYYMTRVLASVYEPPRPKRSVRLKNLKNIDESFVQAYSDYFVPPTLNNRIFKFLYVNKCYRLFDLASMMWRKTRENNSRN